MGSRTRPAPQGEAGGWAVGVLVVSAGLPVLAGTTLAVALPSVATGLRASPAGAAAVVAVYFAAQVIVQPCAGVVVDALGVRRAVRLGLAVLALGSLAAAATPTLPVLLAARAVQGVGVALVLPGVHAALAGARGRGSRRFVWLTATGNITAAGGPLLGGLVVTRMGWRGVFAVTTLLAAAAALALASRSAGPSPGPGPPARVPFRQVLSDPRAAVAVGLNVLDNLVVSSLLVGVPFAVVASGRLSAAQAITGLTLAGAVAAPLGGRLADRAGLAAAARTGFLVAAAGLLALHLAGVTSGAVPLLALVVAGAGLGLELPTVQAAPVTLATAAGRATAAGVAAAARQVGSLGGALLVAAVVVVDPAAVFAVGAAGALAAAILAAGLEGRRHPVAA